MAKRGAGKSFHSGINPRSMSWIQCELRTRLQHGSGPAESRRRRHSLRPDRFLLESADEAVSKVREEHVHQEEDVVCDPLDGDDEETSGDGGLSDAHEGSEAGECGCRDCRYSIVICTRHSQEVHPLVLRFFEEGVDPSAILSLQRVRKVLATTILRLYTYQQSQTP